MNNTTITLMTVSKLRMKNSTANMTVKEN